MKFKRETNSGTFLMFFVAGLFPVLVFILSLSIDFTIYFRCQQKLQNVVDKAALIAWRYLPYQKQAQAAAKRYIASQGLENNIRFVGLAEARPSLEKFNDEFEVSLYKEIPISFVSYIVPELTLPIKTVARTRATPRDIFILFDRSLYMGSTDIYANFYDQELSLFLRDNAPFDLLVNLENPNLINSVSTGFLSQLCFNSYYSAIKRASINLYEYFSAAGRNGVGIATFPGIGLEGVRIIRPVLRAAQSVITANPLSGEALPLQTAPLANEQDFYMYQSARLGASSWCAAAAAQELSLSMRTPQVYNQIELGDLHKIWRKPFAKSPLDIVAIANNNIFFNPEYQSNLSVSEVVWSSVVKNSLPEMDVILQAMISNLLFGPDLEEIAGKPIRAGLVSTSTKTAIILAGDVPYSSGIRFKNTEDNVSIGIINSFKSFTHAFKKAPELRMKLIYVLINDSSRLHYLGEIEEREEELRVLFDSINKDPDINSWLSLELISLDSFSDLSSSVLSTIILDNNNKVLSF